MTTAAEQLGRCEMSAERAPVATVAEIFTAVKILDLDVGAVWAAIIRASRRLGHDELADELERLGLPSTTDGLDADTGLDDVARVAWKSANAAEVLRFWGLLTAISRRPRRGSGPGSSTMVSRSSAPLSLLEPFDGERRDA